MKQEESSLAAALRRWLAAETRGLLGGLAGGAMGGAGAFAAINHFSSITLLGTADPVSIANTYIVYTTFVIAAVALFLTGAGFIFTQHFAMEKQMHMAHAFESLLADLAAANGMGLLLAQTAMKNPEVVQCVEENIVQKLDEVIQLRRAEAGHRESQARIERETLDIFADDLETADIGGKGKERA